MIFKELKNGARLVIENTEKFKISTASLSLALPLGEKAGVYSLLAYLLANSCSEYKTYRALHERLDELYGASVAVGVSKSGDSQVISFSVSSIDDRFSLDKESIFENALSLLFSLVYSSDFRDGSFSADEVDKQKRMMIERIESELSDKRAYAVKKCEEYLFKNEKAGIRVLGTADKVNDISANDLYNAYFELISSAVIQLTVVASCNESEIERKFAEQLEKIGRTPVKAETKFILSCEKPETVEEKMDVTQSKVVMGYRTGMTNCDDNFYAVRMMTDIFGGSPNSKLFLNVREKQGLCYYCGARLSGYKGVIMVQSGVENENRFKAIEEINKQLDEVKNGEFSDSDIASSKSSLTDAFRSVSDTPDGLCGFYSSQITDDEIDTPEKFIEGFESITKEQIIAAAKKVTLDTVYILSGGEEK